MSAEFEELIYKCKVKALWNREFNKLECIMVHKTVNSISKMYWMIFSV